MLRSAPALAAGAGSSALALAEPLLAGVAVVNDAESPDAIARFREAHGLALPTLRDPDGRVWRRFARGLPANLVWTREGRRVELGPRGEAAWERTLAGLGCGRAAAR